MRHLLLAASLLASGCGLKGPTSIEPVSENGALAISETARFAGILHVSVKGRIVDKTIVYPAGTAYCPGPIACSAASWYEPGTAYFAASHIDLWGTPGYETITNVAAHEVCHAISGAHDHKHWECMASVATPTYPEPR